MQPTTDPKTIFPSPNKSIDIWFMLFVCPVAQANEDPVGNIVRVAALRTKAGAFASSDGLVPATDSLLPALEPFLPASEATVPSMAAFLPPVEGLNLALAGFVPDWEGLSPSQSAPPLFQASVPPLTC